MALQNTLRYGNPQGTSPKKTSGLGEDL